LVSRIWRVDLATVSMIDFTWSSVCAAERVWLAPFSVAS